MIIGKVIGNVWATRKEESLNGLKLLVIKPVDYSSIESDNEGPSSDFVKSRHEIVAADSVGAGIGDLVLVVSGSSARRGLHKTETAVDATVVGIIDEVEISQ